MKKYRPLSFLLCLSLVFMWACDTEEVLPVDNDLRIAAASCTIPGVFKQNNCGLFIQLENGSAIFAARYPDNFKPEVGMPVLMAYRTIATTTTSNSSHTSSDGNCGGGEGDASQSSDEDTCMSRMGVSRVTVQCIQVNTDS